MNDSTQLNGRRPFVWRGMDDDSARLTEAVAEKLITRLFATNGSLTLVNEGQPTPVSRALLLKLITTSIAGVRLGGNGTPEFYSFEFVPGTDPSKGPNDHTLASIYQRLLDLVAKGPSEPVRLSPQQQREVRMRLGVGESKDRIASAYGVDVDTIRQLAPGR